MKSLEFRQNNNVLLSAPIANGRMGFSYKPGWSSKYQDIQGPALEYVDLKSDKFLPTSPDKKEEWTLRAGEPSLSVSLKDIKTHAERFDTEIVTPESTDGRLSLQTERNRFFTGNRVLAEAKPDGYDFRSLIASEFPLGAPDNVAWAVDASKGEFLVYVPK